MSERLSFKMINCCTSRNPMRIHQWNSTMGFAEAEAEITEFCGCRDAFFELNVASNLNAILFNGTVCSDYNLNGLRAVNSITFNGFNSFRFTYANVMVLHDPKSTHTQKTERRMCAHLWFRSTCIRSVLSRTYTLITAERRSLFSELCLHRGKRCSFFASLFTVTSMLQLHSNNNCT